MLPVKYIRRAVKYFILHLANHPFVKMLLLLDNNTTQDNTPKPVLNSGIAKFSNSTGDAEHPKFW